MNIRQEKQDDIEAIYKLNKHAFGSDQESQIVDALRDAGQLELSMVALENGKIIGHIAYSPMEFTDTSLPLKALALAPMAVAPSYQKKGVGSSLIDYTIKELKQRDVDLIFLIGHPDYYPRFGFKPAFSTLNVTSNFENVPDEAFMFLDISNKAASAKGSKILFRREFSSSL